MPFLTINNYSGDFCGYVVFDMNENTYTKYECAQDDAACHPPAGQVADKVQDDLAWRFPLSDLPSDADVTKVRLRYRVYLGGQGGPAGVWRINGYGNHGQDDPITDDAQTFYLNAISEPCYVETTNPRAVGTYWEVLGEGETAQACVDVENAKSAVNYFSIGLAELNQDDPAGTLYGRDESYPYDACLEITYELPPAVGYGYSDGLVSVSVLAIMRKAILAVCGRVAG